MKLILRENVIHLGEPGDIVDVAPGYGRNFLLPKGKAVLANPANLRLIEQQITKLKARSDELRVAAEGIAERLSAITLRMQRRAADEETLYGSVSVIDIADALASQGFEIEKGSVELEHPVKTLGEHQIAIALAHGVTAAVKLVVESEEDGSEPITTEAESARQP